MQQLLSRFHCQQEYHKYLFQDLFQDPVVMHLLFEKQQFFVILNVLEVHPASLLPFLKDEAFLSDPELIQYYLQ